MPNGRRRPPVAPADSAIGSTGSTQGESAVAAPATNPKRISRAMVGGGTLEEKCEGAGNSGSAQMAGPEWRQGSAPDFDPTRVGKTLSTCSSRARVVRQCHTKTAGFSRRQPDEQATQKQPANCSSKSETPTQTKKAPTRIELV